MHHFLWFSGLYKHQKTLFRIKIVTTRNYRVSMLNSGLLCQNKHENERKGCLCTTDVFPYVSVASMNFDCLTDFAQNKIPNVIWPYCSVLPYFLCLVCNSNIQSGIASQSIRLKLRIVTIRVTWWSANSYRSIYVCRFIYIQALC